MICNMGVHLDDSLWRTGNDPEGVDPAVLQKQKDRAIELFEEWVGVWPTKTFTNKPSAIPFNVRVNFEQIATLRFEPFRDSYLRIVGRLEDMRNEFGQLVDLVNMEDFIDLEEGEEFEAMKSPEKYSAFKARVYKAIEERQGVIDVDQLAFFKNAAPLPLQPIVVQVQTEGGLGGFGAIGGIMFTLWLLSNMS